MFAHSSFAGHAPTMVLCTVAAVGCCWAWMRRPTRSTAPLASWLGGLSLLLVASAPAVERVVDRSFVAHMAQHLVLWVVVPPLLVLAHPVRVLRRAGVPARASRSISSWMAHHGALRLVVAWGAVVGVMYGTHLTSLYERALLDPWVHEVEHVAYFGASLLLWSTVLAPGRGGARGRAGLVVAVAVPLVILGMVLSAATEPLYDTYVRRVGAVAALADQRAGAALMWLAMMAALVPLLVVSVWWWADREHQTQLLRERAADAAPPDPPVSHEHLRHIWAARSSERRW